MNARQKAKKYKQEIERLKKLPVGVERSLEVVGQGRVRTICMTRRIDRLDMEHVSENVIRNWLVRELAQSSEFVDCIQFKKYIDLNWDQEVFKAEIKVVDV